MLTFSGKRVTFHGSWLGLGVLFISCLFTAGCSGISAGSNSGSVSSGMPSAPPFSISGSITPAANGSGATMTLSGAATKITTADASGNYSFSGISNGTYAVSSSKTGFSLDPASIAVTVKGANVGAVNFTASSVSSASWSISGTISPTADASGASITLSGVANASTTADSSGNYTFTGLTDGSYTVAPSKAGFNFSPASQDTTVNGANVTALNFSESAACIGGIGSANFYVATNGNDGWSGTLDCPNTQNTDGPFASVARAQLAVETLLQTHPTAPITVMLRQGTYYLPLSPTNPGTLNFTALDSGTASVPITWENYPGEAPMVSGGVPVSGWSQVSGTLWQAKLPASTQAFEALFYNGQRRLRSRLQSPLAGLGYYMSAGSCFSTQTQQPVSASLCNLGTFLRVAATVAPTGANANCPSTTSADGSQSKCLDRFQYNPSDPITTWINLNPPSGNPCNAASSGSYPAGDVELTLFDAWTVDVMRVSCVDPSTHILYLSGATNAGLSTQYQYFGPMPGHRYTIDNARDAFNAAQAAGETGIWFLDRSTSPWTLNYLANYGENPSTDTVVIPQLGGTIPGAPAVNFVGASLLLASNLNYVTFSGITFEVDNFIPSSSGFNNDGNEDFALPQAIDCESCQNVTFNSIRVRHTSTAGLTLASTAGNSGSPAADDAIQNSAFYDLGSSGIRIGRYPAGSDRPAYVPQFLTVENNIVQGYSRVFADGEGIAMGDGHDVTLEHNDIDDGYHAGVSICNDGCPSYQWSANGINIITQYNHIWNVMQGITSDGGGLYYDIGLSNGSGTGSEILNNLVHDVTDSSIIDQGVQGSAYGGHGIYLDIQTAGVEVENNVVYHVAGSGLIMTQGPGSGEPANTFSNNIVALARLSMFQEQNPWPQNCTDTLRVNLTHNLFYFDLNETYGFYAVAGCTDSCSMTYDQFQNFQGNLYWRTDGAFASDQNAFRILSTTPSSQQADTCDQLQNPAYVSFPFSQWQNGQPVVNGNALPMQEDAGGTATVNPGFGTTGQASDFLLLSSPISGFDYTVTNDTINTAGRTDPVIVPPVVPATFPTYSYTNVNF